MTVIAAALTSEGVVMACDSQISAGYRAERHEQPKIWTTDQYAIGGSGGLREIQVVKHWTDWPKHRDSEDTDWERFGVRNVWPAVKAALAANGALKTDSGIESSHAWLLVARDDKVLEICGNGAVCSDPCGRMAIGSGSVEALGYLGDQGPWTEDQVIEAVRRATITNTGCSGPITVVNARTRQLRTVE